MFECGPEHVYSSSTLRCIDILSHPYHSLTALTFFGTPLSFFNSPDFCSDHIYINLVEPHSPSRGYTYLLTCIDHFTHGPEAIPISDITAETSARAFISGWISHFGAPSTISTDRGHRFESELFTHLMQLLGIKCIRTTTYCPIANGLVERLHCQLKASLKVQPTQLLELSHYLWCYLTSVLLSTKTSTALPQSSCMIPHSACLVSSSMHLPQTYIQSICGVQYTQTQCCTSHWLQCLLFWLLCHIEFILVCTSQCLSCNCQHC